MSGHAIRAGQAVCLEPETALCRAEWDYSECQCEYLSALEQLPDGRWVHAVYDPSADDDREHVSVGVYPASGCNTATWLNETLHESGPAETWASGLYLLDQHPDGLIDVEWDTYADAYTWDYIEPRVIGKVIGLCAVARWADDLDIEVTS